MRELRTMRRGELYEIEEKIGDGYWMPICQCTTVEEAKHILKNLRTLEGEEDNA